MRRMRVVLCVVGLLLGCAASLQAQEAASSARADQLRQRYEKVLLANPRRGLAFDRLYQGYADGEGVEAWAAQLEKQAAEQDGEIAPLLVLGYVRERMGQDDAALAAYEKAQQRNANDWRPAAARGELLGHLRRHAEAADALRHALTLDAPDDQVQAMYRTLGRVLAASGRPDEATAAWLEMAAKLPDDAVALEELADLLAEEGRTAEAIEQYRRLRQISDDDYMKVRAALAIADLQAQGQDYDAALSGLRDLMQSLAPDSWLRGEARRRLEQVFRHQGKPEELVKYLRDWVTQSPDDLEMQMALASLHRRMDQPAEAEKIYQSLVERAGSRRDVRIALAELCLEQGRYGDAASHYAHLAELSPQDATVWERLGRIHMDDLAAPEAQRKQKARNAWRNIFSRRPDDPSRAILAAEVFRGAGIIDEALEHYQKAIDLSPGGVAYYEYIGTYLHELDRDDEAVAQLRRMTEGERDIAGNWQRLAEVLASMQRSADAIAAVDRAIELTGEGAGLFALVSMRAALLMNSQQHDAAAHALDRLDTLAANAQQHREARLARIELYQQTDTLRPRLAELRAQLAAAAANAAADSWEMLALMHRAAGQREQAIAAIDRALQLHGKEPLRLSLAVDLYREAGNLQDAIIMLRRLIALQPQSETTYIEEIAQLARQQADWEGALAAANRLIELLPDSERGYVLAADVLMPLGRVDEAVATLRRAVRRNGNDPKLLEIVAQRMADAGRLQDAIEIYWRIYDGPAEPPQKLRAAQQLAQLHLSVGRFERLLDRLHDRRADAEDQVTAALALAAAYGEANQPDRAESVLHRALTARPGDTQLLQQLFTVSREQGKLDQAIEYAQRLAEVNPKDTSTQRRLGELLYEAGRYDEAMARWRSSISLGGRDAAEHAIALAETLAKHNMQAEALGVLEAAAQHQSDQGVLLYRLAVLAKQQDQLDRAAGIFDQLMARSITPGSAAAPAHAGSRHMSYRDYGDRPFLVGQWSNLDRMRLTVSREFPGNTRSYFSGGIIYSYSYYGSSTDYQPPDDESLRLASLIHRLHIAEARGKIEPYLAALAAAAGYQFQMRESLKEAEPVKGVGRALSRHEAQLTLLRALLLVNADDEAIAAAQQFLSGGDNDDVLALLAIEAARRARLINPPADGVTLHVEQWLQRLIDRNPQAAVPISIDLAQGTQRSELEPVATKFLRWALDQKLDALQLAAALTLYAQRAESGDTQDVLDRVTAAMPELRRHGVSGAQTATGVSIPLGEIGGLLLQKKAPIEASLAVVIAANEMDAAQQHRRRAISQPPRIFSLTANPGKFGESSGVATITWYRALKEQDAVGTFITAMQAAIERAEPELRPYLALTLARVQGVEGDLPGAAQTLRRELKLTSLDALRLNLAHILLTDNKPADALAELQQVTARAGNIAREALIGQLILARRTADTETGKAAGRRLARMRLSSQEAPALMNYLQAFELGKEAELVARRAPADPRPSVGSYAAQRGRAEQRVQLLDRYVREKNAEAAVTLARRILAEKTRVSPAIENDMEVNGAMLAFRRLNQLDAFMADLKQQLDADPKAVSAMAQLRLCHLATGNRKEAEAVLAQMFDAAPDNHELRRQFADSVAMQRNYAQAIPHYEHLIRQGAVPSVQMHHMIEAYRQEGKVDELVKMIGTLEKVQSLSISRTTDVSWLNQAAAYLQNQDPAAAIAVHDKHAALSPASSSRFEGADPATIIALAAAANDTDRILAEFRKIRPEASRDGATGIPLKQTYRAIVDTLFRPGTAHVRVRYFDDPPSERSAIDDVFEAMEKAGRMADLRAAVESCMERDEWATPIGLPLLAAMDLRLDPPRTERAHELTAAMARANFDTAARNAQTWRLNIAHYFALTLTKNKDLLPLAGEFADACLKDAPAKATNEAAVSAAFAVRLIAARVAKAAGNEPRAREALQSTLEIEDANARRRTVMMSGNRRVPYGEYQEFTAKASYLEQMIEMGYGDIAIKIILDHDSRLGGVESMLSYARRYDQQIAKIARLPKLKPHIEAHIAEAEKELEKRKHDPQFVQHLARWARFAGQGDKAAKLLKEMAPGVAVGPEERQALLDAMMQSGQLDKARDILVQMVREGHYIDRSHNYRSLFMKTADVRRLIEAIEAMPKNAQTLQRGDYWVGNFVSMLPSPKGELAELKARGYRAVDAISGVKGLSFSRGEQNRYYLQQLITHYESQQQIAEAYDYLYRSIFDAAKMQMPEPSGHQLFIPHVMYSPDPSSKTSEALATKLIDFAAKLEKSPQLRETIEKRIAADVIWEPIGRRMLVLMDLDAGNVQNVPEAMARIEELPPLAVAGGFDPSLILISDRAAKHDSLKELATKLAEQTFEAALLSDEGRQYCWQVAPPLVSRYVAAGDHAKVHATLERLWQATSAQYANSEKLGFMLGACQTAARAYAEHGDHDRAADYFRVLQAYPGVYVRSQYMSAYAGDAPLKQALAKLNEAGKLDAYAEQIERQWQERAAGADAVNAEPLMTLTAAKVMLGEVDEGVAHLRSMRGGDYPAGLSLVIDAARDVKDGDARRRLVENIEPLFLAWPELCGSSSQMQIAALYRSVQRPLPIGEKLHALIERCKPAGDAPPRPARSDQPFTPFDGTPTTPGATAPEDAERAGDIGNCLTALLRDIHAEAEPEAYHDLARWLVEDMKAANSVPFYFDALRRRDPAAGYALAMQWLSLAEPSQEQGDKPLRPPGLMSSYSLFMPMRGEDAPLDEPAICVAEVVALLAQEAGRLPQLIAALDKAAANAPVQPTVYYSGVERPTGLAAEAAVRMKLIAMALHDPDQGRTMLADLLAGKGEFDGNERSPAGNRYELVLPQIASFLGRIPEFKDQERPLYEESRRQFQAVYEEMDAAASAANGGARQPIHLDTRAWLGLIRLDLEAGNADSAMAFVDEVLGHYRTRPMPPNESWRVQSPEAVIAAMAQLARRHNAVEPMREHMNRALAAGVEADAIKTALEDAVKQLSSGAAPTPAGGAKE